MVEPGIEPGTSELQVWKSFAEPLGDLPSPWPFLINFLTATVFSLSPEMSQILKRGPLENLFFKVMQYFFSNVKSLLSSAWYNICPLFYSCYKKWIWVSITKYKTYVFVYSKANWVYICLVTPYLYYSWKYWNKLQTNSVIWILAPFLESKITVTVNINNQRAPLLLCNELREKHGSIMRQFSDYISYSHKVTSLYSSKKSLSWKGKISAHCSRFLKILFLTLFNLIEQREI